MMTRRWFAGYKGQDNEYVDVVLTINVGGDQVSSYIGVVRHATGWILKCHPTRRESRHSILMKGINSEIEC